MTKVSIEDIEEKIKELRNEPEKQEDFLRYCFSFDYNIDTFGKFFFPEYIIGGVPEFHKEFYEIFLRDGNDALAAPRGHAKSTIAGLVFISWLVVNKKEKYIVYVSLNHTKTVQFIEPLRYEFKNNILLRKLYPNINFSFSKDDDGRDREDCIDIGGTRIEAVSFEKNLRGFKYRNMRPTLIIGDDIDSDERVKNPVLRHNDRNKLKKVIIPSLDIDGRFKMVGTIIHHDSLLRDRLEKYDGKVYRAIKEDGSLLWGERFTQEKLDKIKEDIGTAAFESEYMNNPIDNATSIIKSEDVKQCFREDLSVEDCEFDELYLGVDFAFSDRVAADWSAFGDIGVLYNPNGTVKNFVFLNGEWGKGLSRRKHWEKIETKHKSNNHDMLLLEENSIKGSVESIQDLRMPFRMFWMGARDAQTEYSKTNKSKTISKINAVNRLGVSFEHKKWIIPYKTERDKQVANRLLSELTSWGLVDGKLEEFGIHPDMPICLILANEYVRSMTGGVAD